MMGKTATYMFNVQDGAVKKKRKSDDTKQPLAPKTSNTDGKKVNKNVSNGFRKSQDADSTKTVPNFWWHSKKVDKIKSEGNAGNKKAKVSNGEATTKMDVGGTEGKSVSRGGAKISKKKALQLKKKRQKKNRRLQKKRNSGEDSVGDILYEPKTWEKSKHAEKETVTFAGKATNRTGEQNKEKGKKSKTITKVNHQTSDAAVNGLKLKDAKKGPANAAGSRQGSSQSLSLQKSGGQKKRKRKKVKKFKKSTNAKDAVSVTGGDETSKSPITGGNTRLAGEEDSSRIKKVKSSKYSIESSKEKIHKMETDKGRTEEVSSNWKALLPIVEKSKESDAKRRKKFGKGKAASEEQKARKPDIWFDDVDPSLIRANENAELDEEVQSETGYNPLLRKDAQECLTKCLAMDCEMVGTGPKGSQSVLARVSVVNQFGACVFDKYVKSREPVTDYRTFVSGIRPKDLRDKGEDFEKTQKELSDLFKGRIVVGHALHNDFKVLYFSHPRSLIRDTSTYQPFKDLFKSKRPGLKKLTELILKVKVQKGEHNSVEDAQAAMKLYLLHRRQWEKSLREKTHQQTAK